MGWEIRDWCFWPRLPLQMASFSTHFTEKEMEAQKDWGFPQPPECGSIHTTPAWSHREASGKRGHTWLWGCAWEEAIQSSDHTLGRPCMRHLGVPTASLSLLQSSSDFRKLLLCTQSLAWGRGAESLCFWPRAPDSPRCSVGPAGLYGP